MKNIRWLLIVLLLICAAIYLGDFFINGGHPFSELGAGVSLLFTSAVFIVLFVRSK